METERNRPSKIKTKEGSALANQATKELITEDVARFLIVQFILTAEFETLDDIKAHFKNTPDLVDLIDPILDRMAELKMLSVKGNQITVTDQAIDLGTDLECLNRFLPRLSEIVSQRVLTNAQHDLKQTRRQKEFVRFFALPDDDETITEARAIYEDFRVRMTKLVEKSSKEARKGSSTRVITVAGASLVPEDFV